jgi:exonuclease SbcC
MEEIQNDLKIQEEIRNKREQLIKVRSESERVGYDERTLQEITREYNEALMKKRETEINLENISQNIVLLERNLDTIEKQIAEVERREKELMDVREAIKTASEFQQSIIETQVLLRNELVSSINLVIDKIWDVIYPYGDLERVQLEATESDYYIKVKRNNEWVVVEGNVSGGERASVALALRVALSIVLAPNLSILALDEPTHNLDENGVKALCDILRERLPKIIGQSFIITHDDKLKEGASGRVYLFSRNKRAGEPTQVTLDNPEI